MSSSAPFATASSVTDGDSQKGGRRRYDANSQSQAAPFATQYPEARDDVDSATPKKGGRRRYVDQDAAHEAPFATASGEPMFETPPPKKNQDTAVVQQQQETVRPPIKPAESTLFRNDIPEDNSQKGGRRRYNDQDQRTDAPFATFGTDDRFKNVQARTDSHVTKCGSAAGSQHKSNNPPPNSSNQSSMRDCPWALD